MKTNRNLGWAAIAALAMAGHVSIAHGAVLIPVTGWAVHNTGPSTVTNGGTDSPTMTPADNVVVMGTFTPITLFKTGDSVKLSTTLTVGTRTTNLGANNLNTQLRIGLFDGPGAGGAVVVDDTPNTGFIIEYSNLPAGGLIRRQDNTGQINPFVGPTNIGNGVQDTGADSIRGANLGPVLFELMLTRNGNLINLSGKISGTDSISGNPYSSTFTATNQATAPNGFVFDRAGFFFGNNVDGPNGTLNDVTIAAAIPEPGSFVVFALVVAAGGAAWWQKRRQGPAAE